MMTLEKTAFLILAGTIAILLGVAIWSGEPNKERNRPPESDSTAQRPLPDSDPGSAELKPSDPQKRGKKVEPGFDELRGGKARTQNEVRKNSAAATPVRPELTYREVTVRSGDTLAAIARRELGRRELWVSIQNANPGVDAAKLQTGQKLKIPVRNTAAPKSSSSSVKETPKSPEGGKTATLAKKHTVRDNETLSGLASKYYSSSKDWKRILDANRDKLKSAEAVRPGMVLTIP